MNIENTLEYKIKNIHNLSNVVDLNAFYIINIWGEGEVKLQGNFSNETKAVGLLLNVVLSVNHDRNGYVTGNFEFEGVKYEIVLT